MALKNNTWKLNQWYDQSVAGNANYISDGMLFIWGTNSGGQLGLNQAPAELALISSPVQIPGTWGKLFQIATTNAPSSAAAKTSGSLWSWGYNNYGNLGQNDRTNRSSPVQVPGTTWNKVFTGQDYVQGIKTDGTLWVWGRNGSGELGVNDVVHYSSPVQVPGTTWSLTTAGDSGSLAIKTDGTLWAWGGWYYGSPVLTGREIDYSSPVQVPGTTWRTAQYAFGCGVLTRTDGTLWTFGANNGGQLGINEQGAWPAMTTSRSSPVQVPGTTWANGYAGPNGCSFGIKTDGTLWSWGYNQNGQLGQNDRTNRSSPVQIGSDTTWSSAYMNFIAGRALTAIKTDGTLWQWGRGANDYGSIGNNTGIYYSSPVQIGSMSNWSTITQGGWHNKTLALT